MPGFVPHVFGTVEEVQKTLQEAAKIGVGKAVLIAVGGKSGEYRTDFFLHQSNRALAVQELIPEDILSGNSGVLTMSRVFMEDGKAHTIAERPGIFCKKINAGGYVPILNI